MYVLFLAFFPSSSAMISSLGAILGISISSKSYALLNRFFLSFYT